MSRFKLVIGAVFVPAIAIAQDVPSLDPQVPQPPPQPPLLPQQPQQPAPPDPVLPPVSEQPTPVIVVNPPHEPPAQARIVELEPETTDVYDSWNAPIFATGALLFIGSYGASASVAASSDHAGADRLYVPVVGPWLALNDWGDCPISSALCDRNTTDKVLLVADGIFQAAGVVTMLDGLFRPTHRRIVTRVVDTKIHVSPTHQGVTVFGHF